MTKQKRIKSNSVVDGLKEFVAAVKAAGESKDKNKKELAKLLTGKNKITEEDIEAMEAAIILAESFVTVKTNEIAKSELKLQYVVRYSENGKLVKKIFNDENILKSKEEAEKFLSENIVKGNTERISIYFEEKNSNLSINLACNTIEGAKEESNLIRRVTGKKITPVIWDKRFIKFYEKYSKEFKQTVPTEKIISNNNGGKQPEGYSNSLLEYFRSIPEPEENEDESIQLF